MDTNCPVCRERMKRNRQLFVVQGELGQYAFDVTKAKGIVRDGRSPQAVPMDFVKRLIEQVNTDWTPEHLAHVDPSQPGILGQHFGALILMDGTHRAVRAVRERQQFYAYLLTYDETRRCRVDPRKNLTIPQVAQEVRFVLRNNEQSKLIAVDVDIDFGQSSHDTEAGIRLQLSEAENRRVEFIFHPRMVKMGN